MSQFDFDAYLANRASADQKLQEVITASQEKLSALKAYNATKPEETTKAWSDQLGLDPGSFLGNRVNDVASLVSGASRLAGQVAALPVSAAGASVAQGATAEDYDVYNRVRQGTASPADLELLNQRPANSSRTILESLQFSDETRRVARGINDTADLTGIVNQQNRQGLASDLSQGFGENWAKVTSGETGKVVSGLAGLLMNAGSAIVSNPSAVREYILENAPQLLIGAAGKVGQAGLAASNIGYAVDEYQKGIETFAKANNGALPSLERQQEMAMQAASLALAEQAGDLIGLHGMGAIGKVGTSGPRSMMNVAKAAAEGFLSEAPTEGFQQYMEGQIKGKDATPEEIYQAAVIGGASGAGLSGGGRAFAELMKATPEHQAERAQAAQHQDILRKAVATGDVSALADSKSASYSPAEAIAVLYGNSQLGTTDAATKQAHLEKADQILSRLQNNRDALARAADPQAKQDFIDLLKNGMAVAAQEGDTKAVQEYQTSIAEAEAELQKPQNPTEIKAMRSQLRLMDAELEKARTNRDVLSRLVTPNDSVDTSLQTLQTPLGEPSEDPRYDSSMYVTYRKATDEYNAELQKFLAFGDSGDAEGQRNQGPVVDAARARMEAAFDVWRKQIPQTGAAPTGVTATDHQAAASKIITLAMASPDRVDPEVVRRLADDTSNGLSSEQRDYLRSFSDARVAANDLMNTPGVKQEIFFGDKKKGNVGIQEYRTSIATAIAAGDRNSAYRQLSALQRFADHHKAKNEAVQEATAQGPGTQVHRTTDGSWIIADPKDHLSQAERQRGGHLMVTEFKGWQDMVESLPVEAKAIDAAAQEMRAAYALKFSSKPGQTSQATQSSAAQPNAPVATTVAPAATAAAPNASTTVTPTTTPITTGGVDVQNTARDGTGSQIQSETTAAENPAAAGAGVSTSQQPSTVSTTGAGATAAGAQDSWLTADAVAYAQNEVLGKDVRQLEAIVQRLQREQEKRRGLLADDAALTAYAQERGMPIEEMRTLLTENLTRNDQMLPVYAEALKTAPRANTGGMRWNDLSSSNSAPTTSQTSQPEDGPLPWETDAEFAQRQAQNKPVAVEPTSGKSWIEKAKTFSDEELNNRLNALIDLGSNRSVKQQRIFEVLDAEMSARESAAAQELVAAETAVTPPVTEVVSTPAPDTPVTVTKNEKAVASIEKAMRGVTRKNPFSLWSAVKHSMTTSDLADVYGRTGTKRYSLLRGKPGSSLADRVANGDMDEFLPPNMRFGIGLDHDVSVEQEAVEYIKEKLRNGDYLTHDTAQQLAQLNLSLQQLEQELTSEEQDAEIEQAAAELAAQNGEAGSAGETASTAPGTAPGSTARVESTTGSGGQVTTPAGEAQSEGTSGSSVSETAAKPSEVLKESSVENQSTLKDTVSPDQQTDTQSEATDTATQEQVPSGQLTALSEKSPEGTPAAERNLLADHFTQSAGNEKAQTQRPLAAAKNFISSVRSGAVRITSFLDAAVLGEKDSPQRKALQSFFKHAEFWAGEIKANLPERAYPKFRHEDMIQFLLQELEDGTVDVEENVKTAISYAAFSYTADNATKPRHAKDKAINGILRRQSDRRVSAHAEEVLGTAGVYQHTLVDALGARAIQALGMKASKNAPQNLMAKLRVSLGTQALKLMEDQGLIKRTTVPSHVMFELRQQGLSKDALKAFLKKNPEPKTWKDRQGNLQSAPQYFFAVARDEEGALTPEVQRILKDTRGSKSVVDKLFNMTPGNRVPSLQPITTLDPTTSAGPQELKDVLLKNQSRPRVVRQDMLNLLGIFQETELYSLIGMKDESRDKVHFVHEASLKAKNDGLLRDYESFIEFVGEYLATAEKGLDTPFYLPYTMWPSQRVGVDLNVGNPQASKIVRALIGSPEWDTTVNSNDPRLMTSFYLRVAEALGMKTERADNKISIAAIKATLAEPVYAAAIAALRKSVVEKQELTDDERAAIVAANDKGGEALHTLSGLVAMARQQAAEEAANGGEYSFETHLYGEVDGVANGTMLNHILLGAGNTVEDLQKFQKFMHQGGFFEEGSPFVNYNHYRGTPGHMDVYESTARKVYEKLGELFDNSYSEELAAIWTVSGQLFIPETGTVPKDGRKLIKDGMNPLGFGSGMEAIVSGMADTFLDNVYKGFTKLSAKNASDQDIRAYVNSVNLLIGESRHFLPLGKPISYYMDRAMPWQAEGLVQSAFSELVGTSVAEVLKKEFAPFLRQRDALNKAGQRTFGLYNAVYKGMREAYIEELLAKNELLVTDAGKRIGDLSQAQEAELARRMRRLQPTIATTMSNTGKNPNAGMLVAKEERTQSQDPTYENKSKFGTPLSTGNKSVAVSGLVRVPVSPGVKTGSATTHSADSGISHRTQAELDVQNIHDAVISGVAGLEEAARLMNKNTWSTVLGYSPLEEAYQSMARVVYGIHRMVENGEMAPQAAAYLQEFLQDESVARNSGLELDSVLRSMLSNAKAAAYLADKNKFGLMKTLQALDQYAYQGAQYVVTPSDRAEAAAKEQALSPDMSPETLKALDALNDLRNVSTTPKQAADTAVGVAEESGAGAVAEAPDDESTANTPGPDEVMETPSSTINPFGTLGASKRGHTDAVRAFFEKSPKTDAKAVIRFLKGFLAQNPNAPNRDYLAKLLRKIEQSIPGDLAIEMITKDTNPADVMRHDKPAAGWFATSADGKKQAFYILGPEFVESAMKVEVLMHEMMHAATHLRLHSAAGAPYRAQLEQLLKDVRKYVADNGMTKWVQSEKLSSIDELIAYGMTNAEFQRDVLAKVQTSATGKAAGALKAFVTILARLLGFKETADANALGVLMTNVANIMQLDTASTQQGGVTTLGMAAGSNNGPFTYSTLDILQGLDDGKGTVASAFQEHLQGILRSIVQNLHGPFGSLKAALMENQAITPSDVWQKAITTGKAPFASKIMASGLNVSSQEAYAIEQVEATMLAVLNASESRTKVAYRELAELYTEVERTTKPADFATGDAVRDQALYDFVFKLEKSQGDRSDYLARFAALGLAHQGFNKVLQRATERSGRKASDAKSFAERLQIIFENVLDFFRSKVTHTHRGQNADSKLRALVEQLVDIEAKNKLHLATNSARGSMLENLEQSLKEGSHKLGQKVSDMLNSPLVRNSGNAIVRGTGAVARTVAGNRVDQVLDLISRIRDAHLKERHGALMSLINEAKGPNEQMKFALLASKHNEKLRQDMIESTASTTLGAFANEGENLDAETKAAISQTFLRSGAHTLLDHFDMTKLEELLADPAKLQAAITQFEGQLTGNARGYWLYQAKALGYYKATGKVTSQVLMMNARNIARLVATSYQDRLEKDVTAKAEAAIAPLVSLYAISYLSKDMVQKAAASVKAENARGEKDPGHGVEFLLKLHRQLEKESRDRLFEGSEELMIHGYTPEIFNPYTEMQIAEVQAGQELIDRGWSKGAEVPVDPRDPDRKPRHIYVLRGAGLEARQTGIVSWTNLANKGTEKHSGFLNPMTHTGQANAQLNASVLGAGQDAVKRMFTAGASFDPTKVGTTYLAPIVNPHGKIVNWRYLMQEQTKDSILERDNRFEHVLGAMAGSIIDKETTADQNKKAMQLLKDQFDAEFTTQSDRYILVGPGSADQDLRETWALLPDTTRRDARAIWGREGVFVRKDSLDIVFGYRKLSVARMFKDSLDDRETLRGMGLPAGIQDLSSDEYNILQKAAIMSVEWALTVWARTQGMNQTQAEAYSKRAAVLMTRAGRMWSEVVAETKDLIVVKTGTVMLDNIWSNLSLLVIQGVPIKDILHHHVVALKGATAYQKDNSELAKLRMLLSSGHTLGKEDQIRRDILRLEDSIARNPISKLVDAGLMPTIVEDIASEDDIYSYKSALVRKAEGMTSRLPEAFRNIAKTAYMTHDTPLYQGLSRVTQLSDFVARYTLYQHLTNRKIEPMSEKEALSRAIDSFVMYDIPMHPLMQYADDTGFFMFTKYFVRIQRVLRTLFHDNPARVAAGLALDHTLGLGPIVLDSAAALRIGNNPLNSGAFKFFGTLDELLTIKPLIALIK